MSDITEVDKEIIENQLDRSPDNLKGVEIRCPRGKPMVLKAYPFKNKRAFPTLFWLSCPFYVQKVSKLEDKGLVGHFTGKMKKDEEFAAQMRKMHRSYARQRFELLSSEQKKEIKEISPDLYRVLKQSGVGGIRDKTGIKCLHVHLADFLARGENPVGKEVYRMLPGAEECKNNFKKYCQS